jgi:predicted dithiol-disulfide oxidoreductase (DUF899 family)
MRPDVGGRYWLAEVDSRGCRLSGTYPWLERAPLGRNETGMWWRCRYEYDA